MNDLNHEEWFLTWLFIKILSFNHISSIICQGVLNTHFVRKFAVSDITYMYHQVLKNKPRVPQELCSYQWQCCSVQIWQGVHLTGKLLHTDNLFHSRQVQVLTHQQSVPFQQNDCTYIVLYLDLVSTLHTLSENYTFKRKRKFFLTEFKSIFHINKWSYFMEWLYGSCTGTLVRL